MASLCPAADPVPPLPGTQAPKFIFFGLCKLTNVKSAPIKSYNRYVGINKLSYIKDSIRTHHHQIGLYIHPLIITKSAYTLFLSPSSPCSLTVAAHSTSTFSATQFAALVTRIKRFAPRIKQKAKKGKKSLLRAL